MKNGPVEKFYLIKQYGAALRRAGYVNIERMSCDELRSAIANLKETEQ